MITHTTGQVVKLGRGYVNNRVMASRPSVEQMREAIIMHEVATRLEELDGLVDEAIEIVAAARVTGPAGERWRADWLRRARSTGVELMGGAA